MQMLMSACMSIAVILVGVVLRGVAVILVAFINCPHDHAPKVAE